MRKHKGFTLVELVVVVMILGILAAVAAPKLLGTSSAASENGLKQTLSVVRDAIERYAAENGGKLPGEGGSGTDLADDLVGHLRGKFPSCPLGATNALVKYTTTDVDIAGVAAPTEGWHYNTKNGQFICNSTAASKTDPVAATLDKF